MNEEVREEFEHMENLRGEIKRVCIEASEKGMAPSSIAVLLDFEAKVWNEVSKEGNGE